MGVVIGIPTFRRPADLARLLASLPATAAAAVDRGLCTDVEILVVDNDPAGGARTVVDSSGAVARYVVEPRPGVAAVRNRILDEVGSGRLLVFIDDDESPADSSWLPNLLTTRQDERAEGVAGPVRTVTADPLDPWIVAGGFFARSHRASTRTGDPIARAATNNLLLDLDAVHQTGIRFDESFGRSGGEDSLFTSQLHRAGVRMVWCAEATVLDHLTSNRQTRAHALTRTRVMSAAGVRVNKALASTTVGRVLVSARAVLVGLARSFLGVSRTLAAQAVRSDSLDAVGRRELMRGIGALEGALGRVHQQYGNV